MINKIEIYSREWWSVMLNIHDEYRNGNLIHEEMIDTIHAYRGFISAFIKGDSIEHLLSDKWSNAVSNGQLIIRSKIRMRIKPSYRMIGDVKCPLPLTKVSPSEWVFLSDLTSTDLYIGVVGNLNIDQHCARGICFDTKEKAIETSKALLKMMGVDE